MSAYGSMSLSQFSDEELEAEENTLRPVARQQHDSWRSAHEQAGFRFSDRGDKMSYEYGAKTDLDWSHRNQPITADGREPEHLYRVEGPEGMRQMQETGELSSNFGSSSSGPYTHVSRFPEGKYAGPDTNVLRIKNEPGRFRGKQTLDRAYAVAEQPIPASDVEDLGPSPLYKAWGQQERAATPPVAVEDYAPVTPEQERLGAVSSERFNRRWSSGAGRETLLDEIFGELH